MVLRARRVPGPGGDDYAVAAGRTWPCGTGRTCTFAQGSRRGTFGERASSERAWERGVAEVVWGVGTGGAAEAGTGRARRTSGAAEAAEAAKAGPRAQVAAVGVEEAHVGQPSRGQR